MRKMRWNKEKFINGIGKRLMVSGVIVMLGFTVLYGVNKLIFDKGTVLQQLQKQQKKAQNIGISNELNDIISDEIVMTNIHLMANTHIVAEDGQIWGKKPMTPEDIDLCIAYIKSDENIRYKVDITAMEKYLNEWKNGDYSNAVELHNMAWDYIGGTIGRAIKVKY